jgi:hypothetical protein
MSIEEYANRQRLERAARAKRIAARQVERAQFYASGGVQSAGQQAIPSTTLSNGPLRIGQSTPVLQAGGIVQHDTPSRRQLDEPLNPVLPKGDVAVLAIVQVADGTWQVWLGGDRVNPLLIMDGLQNRPSATLELLDKGKNDWIVSAQWQQIVNDANSTAIAMRYGRQDPDNDREDWQILNDPRCQLLKYFGNGFWASSKVYDYRYGTYQSTVSTTKPNTLVRPVGLGVVQRSGYQGQFEGGLGSTIAVEYYRFAEIVNGGTTGLNEGGTNKSGFVPTPLPLSFTGVNTSADTLQYRGEFIGPINGPGDMGAAGGACDLGTYTPYRSTLNLPNDVRSTSALLAINLETQNYSLSAQNGAIAVVAGEHRLNRSREQLVTFANGGGVKRIDYERKCTAFTNENLVTIRQIFGENWPYSSGSTVFIDPGTTASFTNPFQVAPGLIKPYGFTANSPVSSNTVIATAEYNTPDTVFPAGAGAIYKKASQSGTATIDPIYGSFPRFPSLNYNHYLLYKGAEIELSQPKGEPYLTWRDLPEYPYPKGYQAQYDTTLTIERNNIFLGQIEFDIIEHTPKIEAGKLAYETETKPKKKALSMARLQAIAKAGTTPDVADIRYWAKL